MSESKHTPGPWLARFDERRDNYQIFGAGKTGMRPWIAITKCESVPAHHEANAHLIAAAPDMLGALKYARRFLRKEDHDTDFVDGVIAKAEGRS
jgi:hypothetical protein